MRSINPTTCLFISALVIALACAAAALGALSFILANSAIALALIGGASLIHLAGQNTRSAYQPQNALASVTRGSRQLSV